MALSLPIIGSYLYLYREYMKGAVSSLGRCLQRLMKAPAKVSG